MSEPLPDEETSPTKPLSIPNGRATLALVAFVVISSMAAGIYGARGVEPSPVYYWLYGLAFLEVLSFWIHADCQRLGINKPLDLGFFTALVWPLAYPYYLVRTRGWQRGLLMIAAGAGLCIAGVVISVFTFFITSLIVLMAQLRPGGF